MRDALSRFWLRARRKSCGLVILSKGSFDNAMGQNSCQPEGLLPESAMAALLVLAIERLLPSPGALPSPILAATHTCFIMLGTLSTVFFHPDAFTCRPRNGYRRGGFARMPPRRALGCAVFLHRNSRSRSDLP